MLSVSVKKMNKDAKTLKHSCYSEGAITRVEAVKRTRASVADKPPVKKVKDYEHQRMEIVAEVFRFWR